MSIELDLSQPGIVFTKFDGEQSLDEVERYIRGFDQVYARAVPYVGITWMKHYARSRQIVDRMGRWMKDTDELTRRWCAGVAIISQSPAFRFVLSAVFMIKPIVCPYVVAGGFSEASRFVREQARLRQVKLPSQLSCPWPDAPP